MKTQQALIVCIIMMAILSGLVAYKKMFLSPDNPVVEQPVTPEKPEEPEKPEKPDYTIEDALASINAEELRNHVVWLSSDEREGRMSGEPGGDAARDYIKKEFESYGYQTMLDEFRVSRGDGTAENVYAWIEGAEYPNEVVVVGAHYDHIGKGRGGVYNGADDNASGTAAVLAMAKALAPMKDKVKRTIVFQLYSGEELGLIGSKHYVSNPKFPLDGPAINKHIFMQNLDMIGYSQYDPRIFQRVDVSPVGDIIQLMTEKYPFAARVTKYGASGGASDHAPFTRMRVPATFLHTGTHQHYHRVTDDADRLNYTGMEFITKYGLDFIWYVSENGLQVKVSLLEEEAAKLWEALDHGNEPFLK
jgi:hypothetical protein